jgi:hypothetical protein
MSESTCEERIEAALGREVTHIGELWKDYREGIEDSERGDIHSYGYAFSYDETRRCFIWLLSGGGPQDEFRFFCDVGYKPYKIEYAFLDWRDGATRELSGTDLELLGEIWDWFEECGAPQAAYAKMADC